MTDEEKAHLIEKLHHVGFRDVRDQPLLHAISCDGGYLLDYSIEGYTLIFKIYVFDGEARKRRMSTPISENETVARVWGFYQEDVALESLNKQGKEAENDRGV